MRKRQVKSLTVPTGTKLPDRVAIPGEGLPYWPVIRTGPRQPLIRLVLSSGLLVIPTHFLVQSKETVPCLYDLTGDCGHCPRVRKEFGGYLAVCETPKTEVQILQLPARPIKTHPMLKEKRVLFGHTITTRRLQDKTRSRVVVEISEESSGLLPYERMVSGDYLKEILLNVWGYKLVSNNPDGI